MRVLIATGIFEPDIGGPATYARMLAHTFGWPDKKNDVAVLTFSNVRKLPTDKDYSFLIQRVVRSKNPILNRLKILFAAAGYVRRADVVYMLDWFAVGFPVALLCGLFGKPYVVRVGGDYLWERYMEKGRTPMTLADFYEKEVHTERESRPIYSAIRKVLSNARCVLFNSEKQKDLYVKYYGLEPENTFIMENPKPEMLLIENKDIPLKKEFVFAGRLVAMKNVETLVRAFAKAHLPQDYRLTIIGEGPQKDALRILIDQLHAADRIALLEALPRAHVWDRMKDCRALVLPSWTDIAPNQVYEAIALGLPALVTTETYAGIAEQLPLRIDPRSEDDIARKLEMLADDTQYRAVLDAFRKISYTRSWADVARDHLRIFQTVCGFSR